MPDDLAAMLAALRDEEATIRAAYEAVPRSRRRGVALLEVYCASPRSCPLFTVWSSPAGPLFYQPPYKLSPGRNAERSNAEGRAANTTDGDRRWMPQAGRLDRLRGWGAEASVTLQCDHHETRVTFDELTAWADEGTPGEPTRRRVPGAMS